MSDDKITHEKNRTCPSCRTEISVLATKCKFCGEIVGKPKEETRSLSINDLGGENTQHRAISSSVMDALESFRIEDSKDGSDVDGFGGIDDFDAPSGGGDQMDYNRSPLEGAAPAAPPASSGIRIGTIAKIAALVVVIAVVAIKAPGFLKNMQESDAPAKETTFRNQAPGIYESTGDPLQALEAAISATIEDPGPANTKIADDMLDAVVDKIQGLLDAQPWDKTKLRDAYRIANQATQIHPHRRVIGIRDEVDQENADYSMILVKIDTKLKRAEFKLVGASKSPIVYAKIEEEVGGRFKVVSMSGSNSLMLEDTKRNGRLINVQATRGLK